MDLMSVCRIVWYNWWMSSIHCGHRVLPNDIMEELGKRRIVSHSLFRNRDCRCRRYRFHDTFLTEKGITCHPPLWLSPKLEIPFLKKVDGHVLHQDSFLFGRQISSSFWHLWSSADELRWGQWQEWDIVACLRCSPLMSQYPLKFGEG